MHGSPACTRSWRNLFCRQGYTGVFLLKKGSDHKHSTLACSQFKGKLWYPANPEEFAGGITLGFTSQIELFACKEIYLDSFNIKFIIVSDYWTQIRGKNVWHQESPYATAVNADGTSGDVINGESAENCDSLVAICGIPNFAGKSFHLYYERVNYNFFSVRLLFDKKFRWRVKEYLPNFVAKSILLTLVHFLQCKFGVHSCHTKIL